jgi:hypothetical protein
MHPIIKMADRVFRYSNKVDSIPQARAINTPKRRELAKTPPCNTDQEATGLAAFIPGQDVTRGCPG